MPLGATDNIYSGSMDPGASGYWYISPPLPEELVKKMQQYDGPKCGSGDESLEQNLCGTVAEFEEQSGSTSPSSSGGACMAIIVAFLLAQVPPRL